MTDDLEFKSDRELLLTIARRCGSLIGTDGYIAGTVRRIADRLDPPHGMRLAAGIVFNAQTGAIVTMSGSQSPITLTNATNPAAATRYLGVIDVSNGTALPSLSVTAGNAALVALVAGTSLTGINGNQFTFGVYPVDTQPETNDAVTVTATLPDGATLEFDFLISGSGETESIDPASAVGAWTGAPAVPSTPV
jgi:hypothetical protein